MTEIMEWIFIGGMITLAVITIAIAICEVIRPLKDPWIGDPRA